MAYLGHKMCQWAPNETTGVLTHRDAPSGLANYNLGLATVMNFDTYEKELQTAIHEFGHLYGVEDHYGGAYPSTDEMNAENNSTSFAAFCIYGEDRNSIPQTSVIICEGCRSKIKTNINIYAHS